MGVVFHESSMLVVFAVPVDFIAGFAVENESEGSFMFPHLSRDVVSSSEFIGKSVSVFV